MDLFVQCMHIMHVVTSVCLTVFLSPKGDRGSKGDGGVGWEGGRTGAGWGGNAMTVQLIAYSKSVLAMCSGNWRTESST